MAIFLAIAAGFEMLKRAATPDGKRTSENVIALDFIAFYTGGHFAAEGRHRDLFDLKAVREYQSQLAAANGVELGPALGPWWNPPFYAWVFAPLSKLPFTTATAVWVAFNALCAAISCWLLVRMLPPGLGWKTYALVPVLMALSIPFIHALSHGQNACTSLLIVTLAVTAWRADKPIVAGLVAGLLAYKPQHAVVLGGMLTLALGWRAMLGLAITGTSLLAVTITTMPGALGDFLKQMPKNVRFVQEQSVYLWERHATFKAFWRLLVQGTEIGAPTALTVLLTAVCTAAVVVMLLRLTPVATLLNRFDTTDRKTPAHRDRLIAATVLATPLVMPFYFDYDLLMLAVPAVLLAGMKLRDGTITGSAIADRVAMLAAPAAYTVMLINADIAEKTQVNPIVPLLAVLTITVAAARPRSRAVTLAHEDEPMPLARAA